MSTKKSNVEIASIVPAINIQTAIHVGAELFVISTMFFYFKKEISALKTENATLKHEIASIAVELREFKNLVTPKTKVVDADETAVSDEIREMEQDRSDIKNDKNTNDDVPNPFVDE